jgi:hypothetical protein
VFSPPESWLSIERRRRHARAWLLVAVAAVEAPLLLVAALVLRNPFAVAAILVVSVALVRFGQTAR